MVKNHLNRIAAPKNWSFGRRENRWTARPSPGPHSIKNCITQNYILKEILNYAKTLKEVKKILNEGNLVVDKKIRKEYNYPVGFMDVLEVPKLNEYYRVIYSADGRFILFPITKEESKVKLLKIIKKTAVKKGKIQLTFHDGRNIVLSNFEGSVGDSALYDLEKKEISKFISLDKGSLIYLDGGSHIGDIGKVKEIIRESDLSKPKVRVEVNGVDYITFMNYAFAIGKDKPEINLGVKQ